MDVSILVDCLTSIGIKIQETNPVYQKFLGTLEETMAKIRKTAEITNSACESLSSSEIQCYERYIQSLTFLLIKENTETAFYLLRIVQRKMRLYLLFSKTKLREKTTNRLLTILKVCKRIRSDLQKNKNIIKDNKKHLLTLYRIFKYEDLLNQKYHII